MLCQHSKVEAQYASNDEAVYQDKLRLLQNKGRQSSRLHRIPPCLLQSNLSPGRHCSGNSSEEEYNEAQPLLVECKLLHTELLYSESRTCPRSVAIKSSCLCLLAYYKVGEYL